MQLTTVNNCLDKSAFEEGKRRVQILGKLKRMAFKAVLTFLLVLATSSLQESNRRRGGSHNQGVYSGHGGHGGLGEPNNQGNCYQRCYSAYQVNASNYFVAGCVCSQYNFPESVGGGPSNHGSSPFNICGYIDHTCRASPSEYDTEYAYSYDSGTKTCLKIRVYSKCVNGYSSQSNIFQSQQACSTTCEARGY
ncbi:cold and drought-regulated protein CORA-like isoform X2 [Biomphalaria glabrata]